MSNLAAVPPGSRDVALNQAAWSLGRWIDAGALDEPEVEEQLFAAAEHIGLVADDAQR